MPRSLSERPFLPVLSLANQRPANRLQRVFRRGGRILSHAAGDQRLAGPAKAGFQLVPVGHFRLAELPAQNTRRGHPSTTENRPAPRGRSWARPPALAARRHKPATARRLFSSSSLDLRQTPRHTDPCARRCAARANSVKRSRRSTTSRESRTRSAVIARTSGKRGVGLFDGEQLDRTVRFAHGALLLVPLVRGRRARARQSSSTRPPPWD